MTNETKHIIYIHGLGSDAQSRKYQLLKSRFSIGYTIECLEWRNAVAIDQLLQEASTRLLRYSHLVIIGDSTGGNFAYQLRELLFSKAISTQLILLNPLLDISKRLNIRVFPSPLVHYLQEINRPENAFIIISEHDEIIDHSWLNESEQYGVVLYKVEDTHRMPMFSNYIGIIEEILNSNEKRI